MKKIVATLMAALLMLGGTPALAAADTAQNQTALVQENAEAVQPRASGFIGCGLTKQSSQLKITATCESTYAHEIAYYYIELQRWTGSSWNSVQGWNETRNGNITSVTKYATPAKGYSYRVMVSVSTASGMGGSAASDPVGW